jgi:hypothetical protein
MLVGDSNTIFAIGRAFGLLHRASVKISVAAQRRVLTGLPPFEMPRHDSGVPIVKSVCTELT